MPVLRSQRTYPLSFTGSSLNTGIVAAYDWAGDPANSRAGGNGLDYSGNTRTWTPGGTTPTVIANIGGVTGMDGRDVTVGGTLASNYYSRANLANLGLAFGTGAFSMWFRVRAPSSAPTGNTLHQLTRNKDASSNILMNVCGYEVTSTGKYHPFVLYGSSGTTLLNWSTAGNGGSAPNGIFDLHVTRSASGTLKAYVDGVLLATATGDTSNWAAGGTLAGDNIRGIWSGGTLNFVMIDETVWSRELSGAEVTAHQSNPYSYNTNSAPADSITVSTPASSSTVGTSFTVSGTYAGSGAPTTIEASFNGSAYQTIAASPSGGTYSGTFTGATPATGTLTVRWSNSTGVFASVTSLTVTSNAIAFTVPGTTTNGAVPHRIFQRNGSNQASVRMTGTYSGTPTSIEYRFAGGAWGTLVASPTGGAFDATVALTGPAQGNLEVRFSNATTVTAALANVGVGDVYMVGGQSNNVGMSSVFVAPVAPSGAGAGWVATEFSKANAWRPNVETSGQPFDDRTGSAYPSVYTAATVLGSYFGRLATRAMAAGVPVAFVPCAMGSTTIAAWASGSALYTTMLARQAIVGAVKGLIWYQGEADTGGGGSGVSQASYTTSLNDLVNRWFTDTGTKTLLCNINDQGVTSPGAVRAAILDVATNNANKLGYADMLGLWSDGNVHYSTSTAIDNVSLAVFNGLYPVAPPASITTDQFRDWSGVLQANATLPNVVIIKVSDRSIPVSVAGLTTNASGVLVLSNADFIAGADYMVAAFNADGSIRGIKRCRAA